MIQYKVQLTEQTNQKGNYIYGKIKRASRRGSQHD